MSDDLISRKALLEEINNFSMKITGSANAMAITIMEETKKSVVKMINEQPTSYDVDKVVEQLEDMKYVMMGNYGVRREVVNFDDSIEAVKSGGIE